MLGVWTFGEVERVGNHEPIVEEELFWEAYRVAERDRKPRGHGAAALPFSGLLWCLGHSVPVRVSSQRWEGTYRRQWAYARGQGATCMKVTHRALDVPLLEVVLGQLNLTPYAEETLTRL